MNHLPTPDHKKKWFLLHNMKAPVKHTNEGHVRTSEVTKMVMI